MLPKFEEGPIVPEKFNDVVLDGKPLDEFLETEAYRTWTKLSPALKEAFDLGYVRGVASFPQSVTLLHETPVELLEKCGEECFFVKVKLG